MNGLTDTAKQQNNDFSLAGLIAQFFQLEWRDKLSDQQQDREEAAYTWGL
ncbi:hypothetical protein OU994_04450 [Pseudoduganella sp. SL102]|uniref:Uncharacterized protein n=1 Tax=Pseudoduganella albidiflava TaxID=321983 RepID=A0AA88C0P6_9BURK|nr:MULTISPECIES: hypothetical protein [Pseudoduganella]WBS03565.1 hypothetical protein OU994_04450 [Pseudoduganella sp. SL102]GGY22987.1 hypothetical protein GCM10007387_00380 [Pseudoduganella albidiflava]